MTQQFVNSIEDFERAYGSPWGRLAYNNFGLRKYGSRITKLMTTAQSGTQQNIVGPQLWANLNTDRQLFAALRKKEWTESGIRVITAYPSTKIRGVAEATSPVGSTVVPSFGQYFPTIKLMETPFDQSLVAKFHGQVAEGITWEQFRDFMGINHGKGINSTLSAKIASGGGGSGNNFETLDNLVSSFAEIAAQSYSAGDNNIFGLVRSGGATFADAQLLHNSGTARDLTLRLLNSLRRITQVASGDYNPANFYWYTGPDTLQTWTELLQPQQRFEEKEGSFSAMNGVALGMGGSKNTTFLLATHDGSPIIVSQDAATTGTISNVYYMHRDHAWFQVVQPTVYREVGISTGQELLLGSYADRGLFYTAGELTSNFLGSNGKLEDLK